MLGVKPLWYLGQMSVQFIGLSLIFSRCCTYTPTPKKNIVIKVKNLLCHHVSQTFDLLILVLSTNCYT